MKSVPFRFKQFDIYQDKTAMKVGTDGVLLGAWATVNKTTESILDIGSGTGLIAIMLAQRSQAEIIDAVELNEDAYVQCVENFERSSWGDRLFCYHTSVQQFAEEVDEKYDLIVSNPPFFSSIHKETADSRAMARSTASLSYKELISCVAQFLTPRGIFALVIPYLNEEDFLSISKDYHLFPTRITRVKGTPQAKVKRSLIELSFQLKNTKNSDLIIETSRHQYTDEYQSLVKDFYLAM